MAEITAEEQMDTFQIILNKALQVPGVRIARESFLRGALSKHFNTEVIEKAVDVSPAMAGIKAKELDKIGKAVITYETRNVTALSAAAGLPGKFGLVAAVPADLVQYVAHMMRVLQKLIYLYGWQSIFNDNEEIDVETLNLITVFFGVMLGVQAANTLIFKLAEQLAVRAQQILPTKALTKGVIYPIVKKIALVVTGKMNKKIFASGVSKLIPVAGAVTSGGLTFMTFKPMAKKLKKHLETLPTANPEYVGDVNNEAKNDIIIDINDFELIEDD